MVYVREKKSNRYVGREIVLGARAGDYYTVKSGLEVGEVVVTSGAFKIDADLQIQGEKSMMNPVSGAAQAGHSGH